MFSASAAEFRFSAHVLTCMIVFAVHLFLDAAGAQSNAKRNFLLSLALVEPCEATWPDIQVGCLLS